MHTDKDYYKILGVPRDARTKQIKSAYRGLAKQWHPDLNNNSKKSEEQFKRISEAYNVISNQEFRRQYDNLAPGESGRYGHRGGQTVTFSMDDLAYAAWVMAEHDMPWIKIGIELHKMGCSRATAYKIGRNVTRDLAGQRKQYRQAAFVKWFYGAGAHACLFIAMFIYY